MYILAIESSCDETSVSIIKDGYEEKATIVLTQIDIHKLFGGVVPEVASRHHIENITIVLEEALKKAQIIQKEKGYEAKIQIEYNYLEALKYYLEKMNIKIKQIEYLEKIEIIIDITEELSKKFARNNSDNNLKISKYDIIKEKFVEI